MKKTLWFLLGVLLLVISSVIFSQPAAAVATSNNKVEVAVFVREGCQHCKDEKAFLKELTAKRSDITLRYYNLENTKQWHAWDAFTKQNEISKVTPITVIGNRYIIGFDKKETTGKEIEKLIEVVKKGNTKTDIQNPNLVMGSKASTCSENPTIPCTLEDPSYTVTIPFIGPIETKQYPLFVLAAVLGFVDGFNPCAMWVLVTFLIILLQVGNRRKMLLFAGTFILAEAIMYTLILTVWFKTWDFVKLDSIVTPLVGILAVGSGIYFLYEYRKKELVCTVTDVKQRHQIKQKIEKLAFEKFTFFTFLGILAIAFSVNVIEFACSLGIPQAFTKILELNNLSLVQSAGYIGIYILFYMIDDLVVFGLALYGAEKLSLTTTYSRYSNLIGGIIMLLLGFLLLLKPSVLLF